MKKNPFLLLCFLAIITINIHANKIEIPTGSGIQAAIDTATSGDTLILAEGGEYSGSITINKSIILKSENAGILPKITTSGIGLQAGKNYYFELEGVEIIGDPGVTNKHMISVLAGGDSAVYLKLKNVVAHDFERTILRFDKATCYINSVIVDNCYFYNNDAGGWNVFYWRDERTITNYLRITNTTIDGFNEGILRFDGTSFVKNIYIDKCTFNNRSTYNATKDANPLFDVNGPDGSIFKMTNCIISDIDSITGHAIAIDATIADTITNCRFFFDQTAVDTSNVWNYKSEFIKENPGYMDAANYNLTLPRTSSFLSAATDGGAIGDPRWIPATIPAGIVAWWKLDNSGEIAIDEVGNSNGAVKGDTAVLVQGIDGTAISFAGMADSSVIKVPDNNILDFDSLTSFSISTVVKFDPSIYTDEYNIVFKGRTGVDLSQDWEGKWYTLAFKNCELRFAVDDNIVKTQLGVKIADFYPMGEWVHIVAVRDIAEDSLRLFLNGKQIGSMLDATKNSIESKLPFYIGNNQDVNKAFEGQIDDLRIYDTVLTGSAISAMSLEYGLEFPKNKNANLASVSINDTIFTSFASSTQEYIIKLPAGTSTVPTIVVTTSHTGSVATISNASIIPGTTTILVTAEDGITTKTYSFSFTIEGLSDDANLSSLTVNVGNLEPAFSSDITEYTDSIPTGTNTVKVIAVANNSKALVTGDGDINVSGGPATANILVKAENGTSTKTYTINFIITSTLNRLSLCKSDEINAYFTNTNELVINGMDKDCIIEIFDVNGKEICSIKNVRNIINLDQYNLMSNSVYLIRIITTETKEYVTVRAVK